MANPGWSFWPRTSSQCLEHSTVQSKGLSRARLTRCSTEIPSCVGVVISVEEGWSSCCCLAFGLENRSIKGRITVMDGWMAVVYAFQAVTSLLLDSHTEELCTMLLNWACGCRPRGMPPCPEIHCTCCWAFLSAQWWATSGPCVHA